MDDDPLKEAVSTSDTDSGADIELDPAYEADSDVATTREAVTDEVPA